MDNKYSWLYATLAMIFGAPVFAAAGYLIRDQLRAARNRQYKTLADHASLNAADRDTWMSGVLPDESNPDVDRLSGRILSIAQLAIMIVLAIAIMLWNNNLTRRIDNQDARLAELQLQLHALAFSPAPAAGAASRPDGDGSVADVPQATPASAGTPMQQVCANLIGRVADAYEKGESSKIGQSLEELVKRVGCEKQLAP